PDHAGSTERSKSLPRYVSASTEQNVNEKVACRGAVHRVGDAGARRRVLHRAGRGFFRGVPNIVLLRACDEFFGLRISVFGKPESGRSGRCARQRKRAARRAALLLMAPPAG